MNRKNDTAYKIAMTGLMAALSYVVFTFGQIRLTLPGGDATSIWEMRSACWERFSSADSTEGWEELSA